VKAFASCVNVHVYFHLLVNVSVIGHVRFPVFVHFRVYVHFDFNIMLIFIRDVDPDQKLFYVRIRIRVHDTKIAIHLYSFNKCRGFFEKF
jgi:hypothetical protein